MCIRDSQWQQDFHAQCAAGQSYTELLPTFFAWVYERLEKIEKDTRTFRDFILGQNKGAGGGSGAEDGSAAEGAHSAT